MVIGYSLLVNGYWLFVIEENNRTIWKQDNGRIDANPGEQRGPRSLGVRPVEFSLAKPRANCKARPRLAARPGRYWLMVIRY